MTQRIALLVLLLGLARLTAQTPPPLFEFHSAFWVNLHHYLHALARNGTPLKEDLPPAATSAEREAWQAAVTAYRAKYGALRLTFDTPLILVKLQLLPVTSDDSLKGTKLSAEDAGVLEAAAPIYRRHRWPGHDAANRRFIASVQPMLAQHGAAIASRVAGAYGTTWPARPIRADVVRSVQPPGGAYTTNNPTHITIEADDPRHEGLASIEMLFHEASHGLDAPLRSDLAAVGKALNVPVPGDLAHAVLFYNAGEITRRVAADAGIRDYRLYMDAQRVFVQHLPAIAAHWPAFLDGAITREEALLRILRDSK